MFLRIVFTVSLLASMADAAVANGKDSMNGYPIEYFGNFTRDWHFVTARFREDTKELRLVYANDLAWNALKAGKVDYPDGAIFGKIGFGTGDDPRFLSSKVPTGAKRYQFMVHDAKKFPKADGWGYELFSEGGAPFKGDAHENSMACAACHRIVQDKGSVFSTIAPLELQTTKSPPTPAVRARTEAVSAPISFITESREKLPLEVKRLVPTTYSKVKLLQGALQAAEFDGTLHEIGPILAREAKNSGMPAALVGSSGRDFALAYRAKGKLSCTNEIVSVRTFNSHARGPANEKGEMVLIVNSICDPI